MIGNAILAFAIIIVVVIFIYMSLRLSHKVDDSQRYYTESYSISLTRGFEGDSIAVYMNDSLIFDQTIPEEPLVLNVPRFNEQTTLMVVDQRTDLVSTFELSEKGEEINLLKEGNAIKRAN